ncbi:MAG: S-layer homology domain-containing protein [Clostridia bacterium]|nr:S-layer homology domain-containing protein [Clostridia bacterium]
MYIDNFSVVPLGNVPDAEYPKLMPKTREEKENTVNFPDFDGTEKYGVYAPKTPEQVSFADVKGHWAENTIKTLATNNYVNGVDENNYSPNTNLTRAQFVKMVTDTLDLEHPAYTAKYHDVKGDEWYAPYLQIATDLSLLDPALVADGSFYPDRAITREEAASIAARVAVLKEATKAEDLISFSDEADVSSWAKTAVKDAAAYGLINGYETGKFLPKNTITRAEAAQILYRIAELSTIFDIYVDAQTGDDSNDGSSLAPLKTVHAARDMVRNYNDDMKNDIYIRIKGELQLDSSLQLGPEDSGSNGYTIVYTSWGDEKATLSTGKDYTGFTLHDADKNIYKIQIGENFTPRQAWFNGTRGILARTISGFSEDCEWSVRPNTYISSDRWLLDLSTDDLQNIEMWYLNNYLMPMSKIGSVTEQADGRVLITPNATGMNVIRSTVIRWPNQPQEYPAYLANSYHFLSAPGEFYIDKKDGYLYYIPRDGEDMDSMVLTLPHGEEIIEAHGSKDSEPIHNLRFENLVIKENDWAAIQNSPCINPTQNMFQVNLGKGYTTDIPAAFHVLYGWYVDIVNCDVTKLGTKGIFYDEGSKYCNIISNEVYDVAMNGVNIAHIIALSDPLRAVESCKINNNYVHDVGYDFPICAGVTMVYARNMEILHNVVTNIPYCGLHIGWGLGGWYETGGPTWNYEIAYNFVNETTNAESFDGGSIYTQGAQQKPVDVIQSTIHHNYTKNNRNAYSFLYLDQGTTSTRWYKNVVDARDVYAYEFSHLCATSSKMNKNIDYTIAVYSNVKHNIVEQNYSTTGVEQTTQTTRNDNIFRDVYVYPDANWPEEAQKIIDESGVEPEYQDNFDFSGPKYLVAKQREYILPANQSVQLQVEVNGLHNEKYPLSAANVRFEISDPEALKIDENGVATSTGKTSQVWVMVYGEIDGMVTTKKLYINAGDEAVKAELTMKQLTMMVGFTSKLPVKLISKTGLDMGKPDELTVAATDPSLVSVDNEEGTVTALKEGTTNLTITAVRDGKTFVTELPVTIIGPSNSEEAAKLPFTELSLTPTSWAGGAALASDGALVAIGNPAYYTEIDNQLLGFDMVITSGSGWPSLMFCADDKMKTGLGSQTIYLMCFLPDFIEIQRFNNGNQVYLFGDDATLNPLVGPGIPNYDRSLYEYDGERISVVCGAIEGENGGTRLILTINGKNLLDFTDTDTNAIPPKGIFGVFTQKEGTIKFYPYSGKTN